MYTTPPPPPPPQQSLGSILVFWCRIGHARLTQSRPIYEALTCSRRVKMASVADMAFNHHSLTHPPPHTHTQKPGP